ncbi:hypothetical protein CO038_04430 [Candidatus Pacearchaeota archaeon CG_4_9_14_0_2_um_filter_39_13]|nr:hypothetical protein [Candidatus Pacearchaeota archaeon]OIO42595.1 MAG: hypothetical protein AUJ64_03880 [Candidatus Pacearchaeota archaeon CG1_02_39_14]PJC44315.1 MAG: hypothetical protein CO038_04430 [Candidatus Pacearchaeota archaeon CG_4_9_14_0_2_um_filter_39_13]
MVAIKYISPIDGHVHLRWTEHPEPFALWAFMDAKAVGLRAIVEQVNTRPALTSLDIIKARRDYINMIKKAAGAEDIDYKAYIGMTDDEEQVKEALKAAMEHPEFIAGDKTFYVHSTERMGLLRPSIQLRNWEIRGAILYNKASTSHLEDEKKFDQDNKFNPEDPITHSLHQTELAELVQAQRQVRFARDSDYRGIFVAHHVSSPETIDFLNEEKKKMPFPIIIETTPHHMYLNTDDYRIHGNRVKMNPPLRSPESQHGVLERVVNGKTDVIGSDDTAHGLDKKDSDNPPSGIKVIPIYPYMMGNLIELGMRPNHLRKITFDTPNEIFFGGKLDPRIVEVEYNPDLWTKYGYGHGKNPFSRIDGTLSV